MQVAQLIRKNRLGYMKPRIPIGTGGFAYFMIGQNGEYFISRPGTSVLLIELLSGKEIMAFPRVMLSARSRSPEERRGRIRVAPEILRFAQNDMPRGTAKKTPCLSCCLSL